MLRENENLPQLELCLVFTPISLVKQLAIFPSFPRSFRILRNDEFHCTFEKAPKYLCFAQITSIIYFVPGNFSLAFFNIEVSHALFRATNN